MGDWGDGGESTISHAAELRLTSSTRARPREGGAGWTIAVGEVQPEVSPSTIARAAPMSAQTAKSRHAAR